MIARHVGVLSCAALVAAATTTTIGNARHHGHPQDRVVAGLAIPASIDIAALDAAESGPSSDGVAARGGRVHEVAQRIYEESWLTGREMAERGGRLNTRIADGGSAQAAREPAEDVVRLASLSAHALMGASRPELRSVARQFESRVAEPAEAAPIPAAASAAYAAVERPSGAAMRLAAFEPRPTDRPEHADGVGKVIETALEIPDADAPLEDRETGPSQAEISAAGLVPSAIAIPAARPNYSAPQGVEVASLEPEMPPSLDPASTDAEAAMAVPLPDSRPDYEPAPRQASAPAPAPSQASVQPAQPPARPAAPRPDTGSAIGNFFSKLFRGAPVTMPGRNSGIAVYDIASQKVYLPGESPMEAHSGLGQMQDDPRYVRHKNRGPTPPNVYNLVMREHLFHGAQAIRLLPADGVKKYNRDGLLAHPYMYIGGGDRSQSNGCVVFKNYPRFLEAFKRGRINRMIVVPNLGELPSYMASL